MVTIGQLVSSNDRRLPLSSRSSVLRPANCHLVPIDENPKISCDVKRMTVGHFCGKPMTVGRTMYQPRSTSPKGQFDGFVYRAR